MSAHEAGLSAGLWLIRLSRPFSPRDFPSAASQALRQAARQELERLVDEVEADGGLQRALRHCRSRRELILAARRLGYGITRLDLKRAWQEEQAERLCKAQG